VEAYGNLLTAHTTGPSDAPNAFEGRLYKTWEQSLIVSILSAGTFFGALFAGSLADWIGRRSTIITGCGIFSIGVIVQVASTTVALLVPGRLIAGLGIGFVSAVIILYMSEVAPKAVRGAIVSGDWNSRLSHHHLLTNSSRIPVLHHHRSAPCLCRR
jgi:MFS family permease